MEPGQIEKDKRIWPRGPGLSGTRVSADNIQLAQESIKISGPGLLADQKNSVKKQSRGKPMGFLLSSVFDLPDVLFGNDPRAARSRFP